MKILIFCATEEDERLYRKFQMASFKLTFSKETLSMENVSMVKGFDAIVVLTNCIISKAIVDKLEEYGIKYCLTRSAGYDHMDITALKNKNIKAANVSLYSPNAIAEYVSMVVLMSIRNMKKQEGMVKSGNYTLRGIRGKELRNLTVGIVGVGRIGFETLKIMSGYTANILLYDVYTKDDAQQYGKYVSLEELYKSSDVIIFHCPLVEENVHMVNEQTLKIMKDGVILINPARGGLWDYKAIEKGLLCNKIAAAAFDVYDGEKEYLRKNVNDEEMKDKLLIRLKNLENVIYTAHSAFYTDTAIENMIQVTMENLYEYMTEGTCRNELTM